MSTRQADVSSTGKRLLVVTGTSAADPREVPPFVGQLIQGASDIFVITPVLSTRLEWLVSDIDRATHEADERLNMALRGLEMDGIEASGATGDDNALDSIADAIVKFGPHHILVALRSSDHAAWQERHLVDRLLNRFHIPMTVFELDSAGHLPAPATG